MRNFKERGQCLRREVRQRRHSSFREGERGREKGDRCVFGRICACPFSVPAGGKHSPKKRSWKMQKAIDQLRDNEKRLGKIHLSDPDEVWYDDQGQPHVRRRSP